MLVPNGLAFIQNEDYSGLCMYITKILFSSVLLGSSHHYWILFREMSSTFLREPAVGLGLAQMRSSFWLHVNFLPVLFSWIFQRLQRDVHLQCHAGVFIAFSLCSNRAVYFACYSKAKEQFNGIFVPNSNTVHIFSAGSAGTLPPWWREASHLPKACVVPFTGLEICSLLLLHLKSFF